MKITLEFITIRDLVEGYRDDGDGGALGKQLDKLAELINHLNG